MGDVISDAFAKAECFLLGRRTYEIFAGSWPDYPDEGDPVAKVKEISPYLDYAFEVIGLPVTVQQAFAMMNDAFLIRQCGHLAARIEGEASTAEAQADEAFRRILLREALSSERAALAGYIRRHGLSNACQLLINSNEFLYVD